MASVTRLRILAAILLPVSPQTLPLLLNQDRLESLVRFSTPLSSESFSNNLGWCGTDLLKDANVEI